MKFDAVWTNTVTEVSGKVGLICLAVTSLALTIRIGSNVIKGMATGKGVSFPDLYAGLALAFVLINYGPLSWMLLQALTAFVNAFDTMSAPGRSAEEVINQAGQSILYSVVPGMSLFTGDAPKLASELVAQGIGLIARGVIVIMTKVLVAVYICTGPIAVVISIFPTFETAWKRWLHGVINVSMWGVSIAILDALISHWGVNSNAAAGVPTDGAGMLDYMATQWEATFMQLGFAISYLMIPWVTGTFISSSSGGMALGSAITAAKSLAGGVTQAAGTVAGGVSSLGKSFGSKG